MPYKRRRTSKPTVKKAPLVRYRKQPSASTIHKFTRSVSTTYRLNLNTGFTDTAFVVQGKFLALSFTLLNFNVWGSGINLGTPLPNSSDFTNLYDTWRLDKVELTLITAATGTGVADTKHIMPVMWVVNDYDDRIPPSVPNQMLEADGLRIIDFSNGHVQKHTVYPRVSVSGSAMESAKGAWFDCQNSATEYVGVKIYYDTLGNTTLYDIGQFEIIAKYHLSFKGVR